MSLNTKGLSIIIPSKGRIVLLRNLLQSIREDVVNFSFPVEVILVDDTPEQENFQLQEIASDYGVTVLTGESHVGGKRNFGARHAQYDYILFLDSDVTIHKGTVMAHFEKLSMSQNIKVAGCLGQVNFVGQSTFAWEVISEMQLTLPFSYPFVAETVSWGPTANISFVKDVFLQNGGFDVTLPKYGGEDVDLGLRLTLLGYSIVTTKDAIADHAIETWNSWRLNIKRLYQFGQADFYLLLKHPERNFLDFPTAPILWFFQILVCIAMHLAIGLPSYSLTLVSITLSMFSYHLVYAIVKKQPNSRFIVHLFGPIIFYFMDLAKSIESIRHGKFNLIFRRIKFIDDMISQDWREISASAWGLTSAALTFFGTIIFSFI